MDHLVQFTISIDDAHIARKVEDEAAKAMKDEVLKVCKSQIGGEANYWGAAYILERGSSDYGKTQEAIAIAAKVLKERIKELDEAKDTKFREVPVKGPLYGTRSDAIFIDEFCGEVEK